MAPTTLLCMPRDIVERIRHFVFRLRCEELQNLLFPMPRKQVDPGRTHLTLVLPSERQYFFIVFDSGLRACALFDARLNLISMFMEKDDGSYGELL